MPCVKTKPDRISKKESRCGILLRCIQLCLIHFAESEYWKKLWKWNSILCNAINESDTFPRHHFKRGVCSVFWNRFVVACVLSRETTKHHYHSFLFFFLQEANTGHAGIKIWKWNISPLTLHYKICSVGLQMNSQPTISSTQRLSLGEQQQKRPNGLSNKYFIQVPSINSIIQCA